MKNILLIGIGGTGSSAVDIFFQKLQEHGNQSGNNITALVFDTDAGDLKKIQTAKTVVMADNASVGTICDRFGKEFLKEWFPVDNKAVRAQEMIRGASQWRKKSYLAFLNLMNKPLARSTFISALEEMTLDPGASCEIYVISSVAGGTGSGSFIPIALYAKRYLRRTLGKDPIVNAMIALPDIFAESQTTENKIKVYANAYAILRELNAINLVARNYNAGAAEHKKAPIRFKIGDANEPNVGLLFDASDKQFWTPEAAPFSQVFLLDKIPALNTVPAHNMVLANSLYTMLCTDIGSAFDSEFSNHELLRSQSNGSNAIYAGISTSQIRFPKESILNYLAHKKTLTSCESEWVFLHNATEGAIREKVAQAKENKQVFSLKGYDYPKILLEKLADLQDAENDALISIVQRCVDIKEVDDDGNVTTNNVVDTYMERINRYISEKIANKAEIEAQISKKVQNLGANPAALNSGAVRTNAVSFGKLLTEYYQKCIESIKTTAGSTADSIITLDKKKADYIGDAQSMLKALLERNEKQVHPVAALILLCRARMAIQKKLDEECAKTEWEDIRRRDVDAIKDTLLELKEAPSKSKSGYAKLGKDRFKMLALKGGQAYLTMKRTNAKEDLVLLEADAKYILNAIYAGAQAQFKARVYKTVASNLDILIAKYRNFFNRFTKEKEELEELVKSALRKDSTNVDSVINIYSSIEQKEEIYKAVVENAGPVTDEELIKTDDIAGKSVFKTVMNAAMAEYSKNSGWNEKDSSAYSSLFKEMIEAYSKSIASSEEFEALASYNVIEALLASCGEGADAKKKNEAFNLSFSIAQDLATPSLRLDANANDDDLVAPSNIMVFMMSLATGKYIKKHAEDFGITLPADQTNEGRVIQACAAEFIRKYSGNNSARVSIVSDMPSQVLYCTGEIMDITPLRIAKFNELGEDNKYFKNYTKAIENFKKYGTDMWNPHLGNDLHKRGFLPYMNEEMEKACDVKVVKALLYGLQKKHIIYDDGVGEARSRYYFVCDGKKITDAEGRWINNKNIAQLINWIRNEDEIIEEWSARFDGEISRQQNALPSLASSNEKELANLESALTKSAFMQMLTESLYSDPSATDKAAKKVKLEGGRPTLVKREGPTALELAYMIKTSEEQGRDCDDAERILDVIYDTFKSMCAFRTNPENSPEAFIQVYKQQLGKVYLSLASARIVRSAESSCKEQFKLITSWLNKSGAFDTISDPPVNDKGEICISLPFEVEKDADVRRVLDYTKNGRGESEDDAAEEAQQ